MADLLGLTSYGSDDDVASASGDEGERGGILLAYGSGPLAPPTSAPQVPDLEQPGASPSTWPDSKQSGAGPKTPHPDEEDAVDGTGAAADLDERLPACIADPPPGPCDPDLQDKVSRYLAIQRQQGRYLSAELKANREYRNPDFLQKMVDHLDIDQYGTCYPPELWNPKALPKEDYHDELMKEYEREMKRRAEESRRTGHIAFTKPVAAAVPATSLHKNPLLPQLNQDAVASAAAAAQVKAQQMSLLASSAGSKLSGSKRTKWDSAPKR